jgi:hypothetical protein
VRLQRKVQAVQLSEKPGICARECGHFIQNQICESGRTPSGFLWKRMFRSGLRASIPSSMPLQKCKHQQRPKCGASPRPFAVREFNPRIETSAARGAAFNWANNGAVTLLLTNQPATQDEIEEDEAVDSLRSGASGNTQLSMVYQSSRARFGRSISGKPRSPPIAEHFLDLLPPCPTPWAFHGPSGVRSGSDQLTDYPPRSLSARKMGIGGSTLCRDETELRNSCLSSGLN